MNKLVEDKIESLYRKGIKVNIFLGLIGTILFDYWCYTFDIHLIWKLIIVPASLILWVASTYILGFIWMYIVTITLFCINKEFRAIFSDKYLGED